MRDTLNKLDSLQVEDVGLDQLKLARLELNGQYTYDQLFENWTDGNSMRTYFQSLDSEAPVIGNHYYLISALWWPTGSTNRLDLVTPNNSLELVSNNTDHLLFRDTDGNLKRYPEHIGSVVEKTQATLLYNNQLDRDSTVTMVTLKFEKLNWKVTVRKT
jgi:hypothetical protein